MCCFSKEVEKVADTNIFARAGKDGRQFLVYSMFVSAKEDLAMVLPLPTPKAPAEDAVMFLNLEGYADFFKDIEAGFPKPIQNSKGRGLDLKSDEPNHKLEVVKVGSFEASFVPTMKDFARLDERFRLPAGSFEKLPDYTDWSFAVFKLKSGAKTIHPMAMDFPRADRRRLYFPTVHIHDGLVHEKAEFDHSLYCQKSDAEDIVEWAESPQLASSFVKVDKTLGIVAGDGHVYKKTMRGKLKNADVWA